MVREGARRIGRGGGDELAQVVGGREGDRARPEDHQPAIAGGRYEPAEAGAEWGIVGRLAVDHDLVRAGREEPAPVDLRQRDPRRVEAADERPGIGRQLRREDEGGIARV